MAYQSGSGFDNETGTVTLTAGSDRIGIVGYAFECTAIPTGLTATLGGVSLTALGTPQASAIDGGSYSVIAAFVAKEADIASASSGSLTIGLGSGGAGQQGRSTFYAQFSGRSQSTPSFYSAGSASNGTNSTVNTTVAAAGADLVGISGRNGGSNTATLGGALTTSVDERFPGGDHSNQMAYAASVSSGTQAATFTLTSSVRWAVAGIPLEAVGGSTVAPKASFYRMLRNL